MFSFFFPECAPIQIENESTTVKQFIQNSYHFKEMKKSAARYGSRGGQNRLKETVDQLENADRFTIVKMILDHFDVDRSEDVVMSNMGRNKVSVFMWFFGIVKEEPNFVYHGIELLRDTEKTEDNYNKTRRKRGYSSS